MPARPSSIRPRRAARTTCRAAAVLTAAGAVVASATPANAHVTVTPDTTEAGAYAVLTVSVPHGCEGSATRRVEIGIPEQIHSVTPTRNPLWTLREETETLAEPITDAHGNQVTERDAAVVYTAKQPLPDGERDVFELSAQLPDAPGETLVFPVVQTCVKGEAAWVETAAEGQDPEELEYPASTVTVTEPVQGGEGATGHSGAEDADPDGSGTASLIGFVAGVAGLVVALIAWARTRRRD